MVVSNRVGTRSSRSLKFDVFGVKQKVAGSRGGAMWLETIVRSETGL